MLLKSKEQTIGAIIKLIEEADAIVIGAGAGLSTAAGLTYSGRRFEENFEEFINRYGMTDMYSAGFYPFETQEEKWAYWSRHIYYNRYAVSAAGVYQDLYSLMKEKNYFVITTNVDHQFWKAGFPNERIFATQGDYGLLQCKKGCHKKLYDNESEVMAMLEQQKNCRIPRFLVPKCPVCGGNMEVHLRCDGAFVEDEDWHRAAERYGRFLEENRHKRILFFELGVGMNTPGIIKYPFWQLTAQWKQAHYICVNMEAAWVPADISQQAVCVDVDIAEVLTKIREKVYEE